MKKAQVMQDEHYEDIGRQLGIEVTVYSNGEESTGFINSDSEYFNLINGFFTNCIAPNNTDKPRQGVF